MEATSFNSLLFLLIGLSFGSFLNVVIDRIPQKRGFFKGRSACDSCRRVLRPFELIPFISFIVLKGRCLSCKSPIPFRNVLVELLTGVLFVFSLQFLPKTNSSFLFYTLFIECCLISIFFIDLERGIIPDKVTYPAIILSIIYQLTINSSPATVQNYFVSGIGAAAFFLFLFLITKGRGMGFGDVKLAFLLGLFLGFPAIVLTLYLAFLTGAIVSLILIGTGKKHIKSTVPFGPFLIGNSLVVLFAGEKLLHLMPFL